MKLRIVCLGTLALLSVDHASGVSGQEVKPGTSPADRPEATYRGGLVAPPLPKPRFVLTDTSGVPFDFWKRTQGSVTLLFFGYTYCPNQCPMHMANIGAALKTIPAGIADQVKLVIVSSPGGSRLSRAIRRWRTERRNRRLQTPS